MRGLTSIVIPIYNERENIGELYERLKGALSGLNYEIVFVDDGSKDGSTEIIRDIALKDERVKGVILKRNYGQTSALSAGFEIAKGDVIITMDGDLQNDPEDIPLLLQKIDEGYDVVSGWRKARKDHFLKRKLPSSIANWIISRITGVKLHDYGCTLKAYRREILEDLSLYGELHRFIPALASMNGAKVTEVIVKHHPRKRGKSKYGLERIPKVLLDTLLVKFLLSYRTRPIHLLGGWGLIGFFAGFLIALYLSIQKLFWGIELSRRPMLLLAVLLMIAGIQLISTGLIAEMLMRTYYESQGKKPYQIKEILSCERKDFT
ncbi:MAG: glycosyltransferase family 2 protein [Synergistetes bacterium]|nr:glycosyltransferase family 2 protein [Synergistota bacterium]MDW8191616.1 glycosyltransferase family 2 protein [Synergistota bacterium]